jgi:hypothetical protein
MTRFQKYLEHWLPTLASEPDDDSDTPPISTPRSISRTPETQEELSRLRQRSFDNSFSEIKSRSSCSETCYIFENLKLLQQHIKSNVVFTLMGFGNLGDLLEILP